MLQEPCAECEEVVVSICMLSLVGLHVEAVGSLACDCWCFCSSCLSMLLPRGRDTNVKSALIVQGKQSLHE